MKQILSKTQQLFAALKQIPAPLLRKIVITALIGAGCTVFGLAYWIAAKDRILLFLSLVLLVACMCRAWSFYRLAAQKKYTVIEGVCVDAAACPGRKSKDVRLLEDSGEERTLRLPKNCGMKSGQRYRLYFDWRNYHETGVASLDRAMEAGGFLGVEEASVPITAPDG